jgi:hypothetical protein
MITNEIDAFEQLVERVILGKTNALNSQMQLMDLSQQVGPNDSHITRRMLHLHVLLSASGLNKPCSKKQPKDLGRHISWDFNHTKR